MQFEPLINNIPRVFGNIITDKAAQVGGCFVGIISFLVDPGAPFYALWLAVAGDFIARLFAESKKHGGFIRACLDDHISSRSAFNGLFPKIVAYFTMTMIAHQSTHICHIQGPGILASDIIYSILFFVEAKSIVENFKDAGVSGFEFLTKAIERKLKQATKGGEKTDE